jgi:hypothetical protein
MSSISESWSSFGNPDKILVLLFAAGLILGFLLTPLGFETRMNELRTPVFAAFFVTVGLLMPLAGIVSMLFRRPKIACVLAVTDASLMFFTAPADQAMFFFTIPPPPAVTAGEYILILVGIGYMLYGPLVYDLNRRNRRTGENPGPGEP